jgi:hypothetical protein
VPSVLWGEGWDGGAVAELAPAAEQLTFDQEAELVESLFGTLLAGHTTTSDLLGNGVRHLLYGCAAPLRCTSCGAESGRSLAGHWHGTGMELAWNWHGTQREPGGAASTNEPAATKSQPAHS